MVKIVKKTLFLIVKFKKLHYLKEIMGSYELGQKNNLPATEAIKSNSLLCNNLNDL